MNRLAESAPIFGTKLHPLNRILGANWCKRVSVILLLLFMHGRLSEARALDASDYQPQRWQGWQIYLETDLGKYHGVRSALVLAALHTQMQRIAAHVEPQIVGELKQVPIWISNDNEVGIAYHDDRQWLLAKHRPVAMFGGIEIENALDFVDWSAAQPWLLLHELAHARHHHHFSWRFPGLAQAYRRAVKSGLYRQVEQHHPGGPRDAYALSSEREYLAELSEAYFGGNDFFPFDREQLRRYDPMGYALVARFWSSGTGHGMRMDNAQRAHPVAR